MGEILRDYCPKTAGFFLGNSTKRIAKFTSLIVVEILLSFRRLLMVAKEQRKTEQNMQRKVTQGPSDFFCQIVRSEKSQNESSPNFSNFCPEFLPRISLRNFPEFFEEFSCFVSWERRPEKIHQKSPPFFNAKFPGKYENNIHNFSGEQAK